MDDGWYVGRLKEIPGVFSQGETYEELVENIADAYGMMLDEIQPVGVNTQEAEVAIEV